MRGALLRACEELDKDERGVKAVAELGYLWEELKLKEFTQDSLSTLRTVVARMHEQIYPLYPENS